MSNKPKMIPQFDPYDAPYSGKDFATWLDDLTAAVKKRWEGEVYWVRRTELPLPNLSKGFFHVSVRPGNNEGHLTEVIWLGQFNAGSCRVIELLTLKSDSGLDKANEIARWLTLSLFTCQPRSE